MRLCEQWVVSSRYKGCESKHWAEGCMCISGSQWVGQEILLTVYPASILLLFLKRILVLFSDVLYDSSLADLSPWFKISAVINSNGNDLAILRNGHVIEVKSIKWKEVCVFEIPEKYPPLSLPRSDRGRTWFVLPLVSVLHNAAISIRMKPALQAAEQQKTMGLGLWSPSLSPCMNKPCNLPYLWISSSMSQNIASFLKPCWVGFLSITAKPYPTDTVLDTNIRIIGSLFVIYRRK